MKRIIYLANPYKDSNYFVQTKRASITAQASARIMEKGHLVYSPILMGHEMVKHSEKLASMSSEEWEDFCKHLFDVCNELWVLCLDGWQQSVGVKTEIEWARERHMPIFYVNKYLVVLDTENTEIFLER